MVSFNATRTSLRAVVWLGTFLVLAVLILLLPQRAYAANIPVDGATCTLPDAIDAANTNAVVGGCLAGSGLSDTLLITTTQVLTLINNNTAGNNATPSINSTIIISGGISGAIVERVDGGPLMRLFYVGVIGDLTFEKVTIRNGDSDGNGGAIFNNNRLTLVDSRIISNTADGDGGGIYNLSGTLKLTNSQVTSNTVAPFDGGGIFSDSGTVTLTNSQITGNSATRNGGGIVNQASGTATLTNSQVTSNTSRFGGGIYNDTTSTATLTDSKVAGNSAIMEGGGIYNRRSSIATLTNTQVTSNTATTNGGGIYNNEGSVARLTDTQVTSNTATWDGGGIFNDTSSTATLSNSQVSANTAELGGGIFNESSSTAMLTNSQVTGNMAQIGGGGIFNRDGSTATLTDSYVDSNTATSSGGGIYNDGSTATLTNTQVTTNTAQFGGGILNDDGTATLTNSQVSANTAQGGGGGIANSFGGNATLSNTQVTTNTAQFGGGILNSGGTATLTNSQVTGNTAIADDGGGIFNRNSSNATLTNSQVTGNTAQDGGGIFNYNSSTATLTNTQVTTNTATANGGGIYNALSSTATLTGSQLLANRASQGGAVYQELGQTTIDQSCIVNNTDTAVHFVSGTPVVATNNWWGAPDGPSGVGPGAGDSVSNNVNFAPFSAAPLLGCPSRPAQVSFSKTASPSGTLLPGQPLTFTLTITNETDVAVKSLHVADTLPADFIVSQVITTGPVISVTPNRFTISQLSPSQIATIAFVGQIDPALAGDTTLTNTATLTNSLIGTLTDSAAVNVALPLLNWSSATYSAAEASGSVAVTVTLTPPTPYVTVTVEAIYTDVTTATLLVTFPPGSSSQQVIVPIVDDQVISPRTILLGLQSPSGAKLGSISSATIILDEDDQAGLAVQKSVTPTEASAGESITYTYQITNTGTVTLSITADDDQLGSVAGLAGDLAPLATRMATLAYVVQESDPLGALVNTVTVTGTNGLNPPVVVTASATVNIVAPDEPTLSLEVQKLASPTAAVAGDTITYTYQITNTGEVTLTIAADDDQLGNVAGLAGDLAPLATASTVLTYTVQPSDPIGQLTNTVTVTGTHNDLSVIVTDTATVTISEPPTQRPIKYLPLVTKS